MKDYRNFALPVAFLPLFFITAASNIYAAEQKETGRFITELRPAPPAVEKDKIYVESYYEPGSVLQGNRTGQWWENTTVFGYAHRNINVYGYISQFSRLGILDYTANFGSYINIDKNQYAHMEIGFGWDIDYIYKLQTIAEYSRSLYKTLFWQAGYNYRGYSEGDSHIFYPGLIYYFGDNYINANYGINWIEGRDTAYFWAIKGDFMITNFLRLWSGAVFGERLYDIFGLDAREEDGYILFGGVTLNVYKGIDVKVGGSYGQEDPKFIKRSLIFDLSVKF